MTGVQSPSPLAASATTVPVATAEPTSVTAPTSDNAADIIVAPTSGSLKPVTDVPDPTFAAKILGDGFAVVPSSGSIVSPVTGLVTTIAQAKHAIGVTTASGIEVLIHVGVDTVELKGSPFAIRVEQGQSIAAGDPLLEADLDAIRQSGKPTDVIVVFTNPAKIASLELNTEGVVSTADRVGSMTAQ